MARYVARINSPRSPEEAFDYMADMTNFALWDPGVVKAVPVDGTEMDPPRAVDVTVKGLGGSTTTLRYKVQELDRPNRMVARAKTKFIESLDTITVEATEDGSLVTYDAELTLHGLLTLANPLLQPIFNRIGDKAKAGMVQALDGTPAETAA
ncbi:MAG: SRPBCC family protein [Actinomycetota bacterium]